MGLHLSVLISTLRDCKAVFVISCTGCVFSQLRSRTVSFLIAHEPLQLAIRRQNGDVQAIRSIRVSTIISDILISFSLVLSSTAAQSVSLLFRHHAEEKWIWSAFVFLLRAFACTEAALFE